MITDHVRHTGNPTSPAPPPAGLAKLASYTMKCRWPKPKVMLKTGEITLKTNNLTLNSLQIIQNRYFCLDFAHSSSYVALRIMSIILTKLYAVT